jgi:hypothetical protein
VAWRRGSNQMKESVKKTKSQRSIFKAECGRKTHQVMGGGGVRTRSTTNLIQSPDLFFYFIFMYTELRKRKTPRLSHVFNLSFFFVFFFLLFFFHAYIIFAVFDFMISFILHPLLM